MRFASSTSCAAVSRSTLADVLEEELERVRGDLLDLHLLGDRLVLVVVRRDDLDLQLVERLVEVVDLPGVEVELVERHRHVVGVQRPRLAAGLQERAPLLALEHRYPGRNERLAAAHVPSPPAVEADKLAAT